MSFLYEQVHSALDQRVRATGGWGEHLLYLGFRSPMMSLPGSACRCLSPLEGDDLSGLPSAFDQVLINLQLAWWDPVFSFHFVARLLRPGGRFHFASFGPDTLWQLDEAWRTVDAMPHVHPFVDMHHLGDAMLAAGFQDPIVDVDRMDVEYEDVDLLMADLRQEGFHNVSPERRKGLTGRHCLQNLQAGLEGKPLTATFELIYGYAQWPAAGAGEVLVAPPVHDSREGGPMG